jgi:hypothetical protein
LVTLILALRDLWLRPQLAPFAKAWWLVALLFTGGIGWIVYLPLHFFRARGNATTSG